MKKSTRKKISKIITNILIIFQLFLVVSLISTFLAIPILGNSVSKLILMSIVAIEVLQWIISIIYQYKMFDNYIIKKVCKNEMLQLMFYGNIAINTLIIIIIGVFGQLLHIPFSVTIIGVFGLIPMDMLFIIFESNIVNAEKQKEKEKMEELNYWHFR